MLHRYVIYMQELQVLCRELKEDKLNLQAYKALLCIAQLFDGEKRGKFPAVTRHLQTLLWHPKAVSVLHSELQPPQKALFAPLKGAHRWGDGPSPLAPLNPFVFSPPWTGVLSCPSLLPIPTSAIY